MSEPKDKIIFGRLEPFKPTIKFVMIFCVSDFSGIHADPLGYDIKAIDDEFILDKLNKRRQKIRNELAKDPANDQELQAKRLKGQYINLQLEDYKKYIIENKEKIAQKLVEKIIAVKLIHKLPGCINDARDLMDFSISILDIDIQNRLHLLCDQKDVNQICRRIKFQTADVEETKEECIYFHDAKDEEQRKLWKTEPKRRVPESMLPPFKMQYSGFCPDSESYISNSLEKRTIPTKILPPSQASYSKVMKEYISEAKQNPKEQYLFLQFFASHGYIIGGFQCVATPFYDALYNSYQMIDVEHQIRFKSLEFNIENHVWLI